MKQKGRKGGNEHRNKEMEDKVVTKREHKRYGFRVRGKLFSIKGKGNLIQSTGLIAVVINHNKHYSPSWQTRALDRPPTQGVCVRPLVQVPRTALWHPTQSQTCSL